MSKRKQILLFIIAFLLPLTTFLVSLFFFGPNSSFIGIQNYLRIILQDKLLIKALINTYKLPLAFSIVALILLGWIYRFLHKKTKTFILRCFYPISFILLCIVWHSVSIIHSIIQRVSNITIPENTGMSLFRHIIKFVIISVPSGYVGIAFYFTLMRIMLFVICYFHIYALDI